MFENDIDYMYMLVSNYKGELTNCVELTIVEWGIAIMIIMCACMTILKIGNY